MESHSNISPSALIRIYLEQVEEMPESIPPFFGYEPEPWWRKIIDIPGRTRYAVGEFFICLGRWVQTGKWEQ